MFALNTKGLLLAIVAALLLASAAASLPTSPAPGIDYADAEFTEQFIDEQ